MKVQLLGSHECIVTRESGDPKFYGVVGAAGESRLLAHVKRELNRQGFDFIKKRMHKDGHLVDELQQYLRTRKAPYIAVYNDQWAVRGAEQDYNDHGVVTLRVESL